jgi:hypothetical protein
MQMRSSQKKLVEAILPFMYQPCYILLVEVSILLIFFQEKLDFTSYWSSGKVCKSNLDWNYFCDNI